MSYAAANLRSNNPARRLALVSAFVACSAPRGLGFIPAVRHSTGSVQEETRRRWGSAAPAARHISSSSRNGGSGSSRQDVGSRFYSGSGSGSGRRRRRKRERVSMTWEQGEGPGATNGAGGRLGPGKGTQVVLLRHGMSTFNKLNIFTVRAGHGRTRC